MTESGGIARNTNLKGKTETTIQIFSYAGSQAMPAHPSGKGRFKGNKCVRSPHTDMLATLILISDTSV